jgi:putative ABC transport system permease protein
LEAQVKEIPGISLGSGTSETTKVGDNRQGESLVVGVNPAELVSNWSLTGRFLNENQTAEAVVGDTLAQEVFSAPLNQGIRIGGQGFSVVGVCLDPINNGNVTYVAIRKLLNITGLAGPNMVMVQLDSSANKTDIIRMISATIADVANDFQVFDLEGPMNKSLDFLNSLWSAIMFLPLFSLVASSLSLLGYVVLTINEQRQEFGILRALGARPKTVVSMIFTQSLIVVLASYSLGVAFGTILTLLILVQEPLVTAFTVIDIAGWLLVALIATVGVSIYPAIMFARKPLLETITNP